MHTHIRDVHVYTLHCVHTHTHNIMHTSTHVETYTQHTCIHTHTHTHTHKLIAMGKSAVPMASLPEHQLLPSPPVMLQQQSEWPLVRRDMDAAPPAVTRIPSSGRVTAQPGLNPNLHQQQSMPSEYVFCDTS